MTKKQLESLWPVNTMLAWVVMLIIIHLLSGCTGTEWAAASAAGSAAMGLFGGKGASGFTVNVASNNGNTYNCYCKDCHK